MSWIAWIAAALAVWLAVGVLVGVLLGRTIRHRDRQVPTDARPPVDPFPTPRAARDDPPPLRRER